MRLDHLSGLLAVGLVAAYFVPIAMKVKALPLDLVLVGGLILVAVDCWESLRD